MSKRTDLIGERGENLVKIAFAKLLQWVARKDDLDDGIDLNVEIPAEAEFLSERFLAQVKTFSKVTPLGNGHWSTTLKRTALKKYKRSKHVVLLIMVDLRSSEIRWLDCSGLLRIEPERRTFSIGPEQVLNEATAAGFALAVRNSIEEQADAHRPPTKALEYRAKRYEAQDPRFKVTAEIIQGVERYSVTAIGTVRVAITVTPATVADARALEQAYEFGSLADIRVAKMKFDGPRFFNRANVGDSRFSIQPRATPFRAGIVLTPESGAVVPVSIEVNAEISRGVRGFEVRTNDPQLPLHITLRLEPSSNDVELSVQVLYDQWDGKPFAQLPLVEKVSSTLRAIGLGARLQFYGINYGDRVELLSGVMPPREDATSAQDMAYLDILWKCSRVSRHFGLTANLDINDVVTLAQANNIELAYKLIESDSVEANLPPYILEIPPINRDLLKGDIIGIISLRMSLPLAFGKTQVGELQVRANIADYRLVDNDEGTMRLESGSPALISLFK